MNKRIIAPVALAVAGMFVLSACAGAAEEPAPAPEETTEETTETGSANNEALDMGQEVQQQPTYIKEEFGDFDFF